MNKKDKVLAFWLSGVVLSLILFELFKGNKAVMNVVAAASRALRKCIAAACSILPFSVAELFWSTFFVACVIFVIIKIVRIFKTKKEKLKGFLRLGAALIAIVLSVTTGMAYFWGVEYYADSFLEKSGLIASPVSVDELYAATLLFAEKVSEAAPLVSRGDNMACNESYKTMLKKSGSLYKPIEAVYPFLKSPQINSKPMALSKFFSVLGFTGYYFPFTGESNINVDIPSAFIPSTIAHELAHVRGIAPEQIANFVAIRACEESGDALFEYSGWLMGYIHLSNALYSADKQKWQEASNSLSPLVKADLSENNIYWSQFESPVADTANKAYSEFLKGYDQPLGSKSYGAVVDLIVAYYL